MNKKKLVLPESLKELSDWDGKEINHEQQVHLHNHKLGGWIKEIKESEFEKWLQSTKNLWNYDHETKFKECWQASQENRDLLYKDLIKMLTDYYNGDVMKQNSIIFKELNKIKKALTSNV